MREMTVVLSFTKHCLGNARRGASAQGGKRDDRLYLPRAPDGRVLFMSQWHRANLAFAANVANRHQDEINKIYWDISVELPAMVGGRWFRRCYTANSRERFALHEAIFPGETISINCVIPTVITDDDFLELFRIAGRYRGLSPYKAGEWGHFEVSSIRTRRGAAPEVKEETKKEEEALKR